MDKEIEKIKSKMNELENRVKKIEELIDQEKPSIKSKPKSLPELMLNYHQSNNKEKALIVGYFFEYVEEKENFTSKEIEEGFKKCKFKTPANMSDVLANASGKGWVIDVGKESGTKLWVLTETGEKYVEDVLKDEP